MAVDDTAGTATLTWTQYEGDQPFAEYHILRRVQGLESGDTLATIAAPEQTSFIDSALAENLTRAIRFEAVKTAASKAAVHLGPQAIIALTTQRAAMLEAQLRCRHQDFPDDLVFVNSRRKALDYHSVAWKVFKPCLAAAAGRLDALLAG